MGVRSGTARRRERLTRDLTEMRVRSDEGQRFPLGAPRGAKLGNGSAIERDEMVACGQLGRGTGIEVHAFHPDPPSAGEARERRKGRRQAAPAQVSARHARDGGVGCLADADAGLAQAAECVQDLPQVTPETADVERRGADTRTRPCGSTASWVRSACARHSPPSGASGASLRALASVMGVMVPEACSWSWGDTTWWRR